MKTRVRLSAMIAAGQLLLGSAVLHSSEVSHFPGSYFDSSGRTQLQARVMQTWPCQVNSTATPASCGK